MGKNQFKVKKGRKRKIELKYSTERKHYEEFGEAHPVDDRSEVKRIRMEDQDDRDKDDPIFSDENISSEDEEEDNDAVTKLLATFRTDANAAVDSDDEDSDDEEDEASLDSDEENYNSEDEGLLSKEEEEENDDDEDSDELLPDDENKIEPHKVDTEIEDLEDEGDDAQEKEDPFTNHFDLNLDTDSAELIKNSESWASSFEEWPTLKRIKIDIPKIEKKQQKLLLLASDEDNNTLPNIGCAPKRPIKKKCKLAEHHILQPLMKNISLLNNTASGFTERQQELFSILSNYSDLYYPEANHEKYEEIKTVYAFHALNHVLKTRKRVLRHNSKMQKGKNKKKKRAADICYRDQGYTRPKVLILLPFKNSAFRVVEIMSSLMKAKNFEVLRQSRFREEYGPQENQEPMKKLNRSEDFHKTFKGNSGEDFKLGMKVTKRSLKLFTDFYDSDIIIASPLGLRCLMGSSELGSSEMDFLTSIEVLIIDHADILLMQNWEHILILMEIINKQPHDIHKLDTDLTRIRMWTLDGHAALYRQTILFTAMHIDHNRALINKCRNFTGRIQVLNPVKDGSVQQVVADAELILSRVVGMRDLDKRFSYFVKEVLPQYRANRRIGVLVYIPDYCDYVRLVKYLKEDGGTSFISINEYLSGETAKLAKIRSLFFDGKKQFMLYTERFHFYRRYRIKGVRHVIFYDLPTYPHFFSEICNFMVAGNQNRRTQKRHIGNSTATVLYQQTDLTKLVGVLGSQRAGDIIKATKSVHVCVLGS